MQGTREMVSERGAEQRASTKVSIRFDWGNVLRGNVFRWDCNEIVRWGFREVVNRITRLDCERRANL